MLRQELQNLQDNHRYGSFPVRLNMLANLIKKKIPCIKTCDEQVHQHIFERPIIVFFLSPSTNS